MRWDILKRMVRKKGKLQRKRYNSQNVLQLKILTGCWGLVVGAVATWCKLFTYIGSQETDIMEGNHNSGRRVFDGSI